jgi:putative lysine transport system permease protein
MFIIGFTEFFATHRAAVGATYKYFPSATIEMVGYLCMTLAASFLLRWLEKRLDGSDNYELVQIDQLTMTAGTYNHPDKGTPFDERSLEYDETQQESRNASREGR